MGTGFKKGGGYDLRTKKGREMQKNEQNAHLFIKLISLPFKLVFGIFRLIFRK